MAKSDFVFVSFVMAASEGQELKRLAEEKGMDTAQLLRDTLRQGLLKQHYEDRMKAIGAL